MHNNKTHTDMVCDALSAHIEILEKKVRLETLRSYQYPMHSEGYNRYNHRAWLAREQIKCLISEIESKGRTHHKYETVIASVAILNEWRDRQNA